MEQPEEENDVFLIRALNDVEEDEALIEAAEITERQYRQQQQLGGGVAADNDDRRGRFQFLLQLVIDRQSAIMGVHERVFRTRVRQEGRFIGRQSLSGALV